MLYSCVYLGFLFWRLLTFARILVGLLLPLSTTCCSTGDVGESRIGTLCALPRVAQVRIDLSQSGRVLHASRMHNVQADGALEQVRRVVGSIGLLRLHLGLAEPAVQLAHGAEGAHRQLRMKAAPLKKIKSGRLSRCHI